VSIASGAHGIPAFRGRRAPAMRMYETSPSPLEGRR